MSRSYKKHCGSSLACSRSEKLWRKQWHSAMRAMERDLLRLQQKYPENDYCYSIPREAGNLWDAPSDGGSQWMYSGFEQYFFEETHLRFRWPWLSIEIPAREEAWKEWKKERVGKVILGNQMERLYQTVAKNIDQVVAEAVEKALTEKRMEE